ncbi:Importin-13 [Lamellibrachia satsuma]|nr:Importin-13 [Lamellibrachia satsuma]
MEFNAEHIEKAVHQFYQDASYQAEINRWLTAAQVSPQAWQFCWPLMAKEKNAEVQFFGASCLHVKIARYWHEVPADHVMVLREQLLTQVASFAEGPKTVLTQLCVALASLVLNTVNEIWPDAIADIIMTFQPTNLPHLQYCVVVLQYCVVVLQYCVVVLQGTHVYLTLLQVLTVLPEEFGTCHLSPHRKGVVRHELQKGLPQILPLVQSLLTAGQVQPIYNQSMHCFARWMEFGAPLADVESLVACCFDAVRNSSLFETAVDALIAVFAQPDNHRFPHHVQNLLPRVLELDDVLQRAMEDRDTDVCQGLTRLVVAAADHNTKLLIQGALDSDTQRQISLAMVTLVLKCTAMPGYYPVDECCSDLPFSFWYNFQDDILGSEKDQYLSLTQVFSPMYLSLVEVLLHKVRYPPDAEYNSWDGEEKESHRCYRQDIADTLMYSYAMLHEALLSWLCRYLSSALEKVPTEEVTWQELDAMLFSLSAIAENIDQKENVYLPQLFQMLSRVPCTSYKVVSQALDLIGAYADWISSHPEVLGLVLPLMLQGLREPELAQSATLSLKEVLQENQENLQPYVADILNASKEALDKNNLKARDTVRLMSCLGYTLSVVPVPQTMAYLNVLLTPHIQQLQALATCQPSAATKAVLQLKINMLSWLFSSLSVESDDANTITSVTQSEPQQQPVLLVMQQVLPVIRLVLQNWVVDPAVVENVCDMMKKAMRTLLDNFVPVVKDVAQLTTDMYNSSPQPPMLDLAKQILVLFSADDTVNDMAIDLFHNVCTKTLSLFQMDVREYSDIVEAFMAFLSQITKKSPKLLGHENCNILGLFQAGVVGLGMNESPTVKASCQFLSELIHGSDKLPAAKDVIARHGLSLIERLMRAVGGESPRAVIDSMADVFWALNKWHLESMARWMNEVVNQDGFPSPKATREEKEQFARRVLKERVNKRRLKETVQQFTLLWRGLMGTEYAAQTTSIMEDPSAE